ncbi:hypothetical protein APHNP_0366 [Anaplasma phagocytophilum str. ApNP]|uniref:Uncharacterized protein n=1 Tax=Anaplasma phagocytophilum str. ApNP TaxID=1359153 RepID=A0A0F3NJN9_ANAPH|nr:hypothetical protein APHNP_0366 [Anaplasma phagocytophilum str. ApNP]
MESSMSTFHRFGFFAKKLRFMAIIRKDSLLCPLDILREFSGLQQ